jgi:hypothetical protein
VNLLTAEQVIDRLSESPRTRRLAVTCVLPAVWCEAGWRFRARDLESWIAQHGGTPKSEATAPRAN